MHEYKYVQQFPGVSNMTDCQKVVSLTTPEETYGTETILPKSTICKDRSLGMDRSLGTDRSLGKDRSLGTGVRKKNKEPSAFIRLSHRDRSIGAGMPRLGYFRRGRALGTCVLYGAWGGRLPQASRRWPLLLPTGPQRKNRQH